VIGGVRPGNEGVKGVDDGASGGLTQNGELVVSPAARLAASAVGVGSRRGGSTVRMKLSLNSALSSGLLLLLVLRSRLAAAMALASAPCMHEQKVKTPLA
jgi:hypothetical protein